jgi:hypothetical protein
LPATVVAPSKIVAWLAAPRKDRDTMMKMCNDAAMSKPQAAFCANVLALGGAS